MAEHLPTPVGRTVMIVLAMLLSAIFLLVLGVIALFVLLCCEPEMRRVVRPTPLVQPGWAVAGHKQNENMYWPSLNGDRQPAASAGWPGTWVGPAVPAHQTPPTVMQHVESRHEGFLQQRRHLSGPARRVMVHGGSR